MELALSWLKSNDVAQLNNAPSVLSFGTMASGYASVRQKMGDTNNAGLANWLRTGAREATIDD
jgi:hypothetical protein